MSDIESSHLRPAQRAKFREQLAAMAAYNRSIVERCKALNLPADDRLFQEAQRTADAIEALLRTVEAMK